jgi:hypothetical protein
MPVPSSHQLRVFGAYSRRIREGMVRVEAAADVENLLVSAFADKDGRGTVIVLNRAMKPRRVRVVWPGVKFREMELVDPYHENDVRNASTALAGEPTEVTIAPGAILTLSNVALGELGGKGAYLLGR